MGEVSSLLVLGAGAWGSALAALVARGGTPTRLWGHRRQMLEQVASIACNQRYLPGLSLPPSLAYEYDLARALRGIDLVLIVVPSHAFASILDQIAPLLDAETAIAWGTKGFEPGTGRFLHELVATKLPGRRAAVISGPSFAEEVAAGLPTAVTVHSKDLAFAKELTGLLQAPNFRAYPGQDVLGAELGGAMKNVLAAATGVADGMGLGLNARAGLMTRGMHEMLRLGMALGARPETLIGLAGLGDLVLTCTGDLSRNRRLGLALGKGVAIEQALHDIGQVVESVHTARELMRLSALHTLDLPITAGVCSVLNGQSTPGEVLKTLMVRDQKQEYPVNFFKPD